MKNKHTCKYCKYWTESKVIKRVKAKTGPDYLRRKCKYRRKLIDLNTESCRFFNPQIFWCNNFEYRVDFITCLLRRRNILELETWKVCKKCRQFDTEVKNIVIDYWVNGVEVRIPKAEDIIKRKTRKELREHVKKKIKDMEDTIGKRKIKRRSKIKPETRKIKRRTKTSKVRKIKRRC